MSENPNDPAAPATSSLQFDTAEFTEPGGATTDSSTAQPCAACGAPTTGTYYAVGGRVVCPTCRGTIVADFEGGSPGPRFLKAAAMGVGAAILCSIGWFLIIKITDMNLGIVSVAVGWLVGTAVAKGSGHRGGVSYQALAMFLAYASIAGAFVPIAVGAAMGDGAANEEGGAPTAPADAPGPGTETAVRDGAGGSEGDGGGGAEGPDGLGWVLLMLVGALISLPIVIGVESPLSGLIFCFALWEAWKLNRKRILEIAGPFERPSESPPAEAPTT